MSLPYASFVTAWLALGLGEVPTALLPAQAISSTDHTRDEITERAWTDLFERELALGRQLDEGLAGTLRVLAGAVTRYYAFFHEGDGDTRSLLVAGARAVAMVDGGIVTLRPSRSNSGARELVGLLPHIPKAPGEVVSAPVGELDRMRGVLAQPRTGGGQLYAARKGRDGRHLACARPLSYIETAAGRVIATEHRASDGIRWCSLLPADQPLLVKRLGALLPGSGRARSRL